MIHLRRVSSAELDYCETPRATCEYLGEGLARWLIRAEDRRAVGLERPKIPQRSGQCQVFFVVRQEGEHGCWPPALSSAFALPFVWVEGRGDSEALPAGMEKTAKDVRDVIKREGWGLCLARELENYDLSGLRLDGRSALAPFAAALEIAVLGGRPSARVFSTGRWAKGHGIAGVDGVAQKVQAVEHLHESSERALFFVPSQNLEEAEEKAGGNMEIRPYPALENRWAKALEDHLRALDIPPSRELYELDERLAYANRRYVRASPKTRREYHLTHLCQDLAVRLRQNISHGRVTRLVTALSFSYELATMVIRALAPERVRLVVSPETEKLIEKVHAAVDPAVDPARVETVNLEAGKEENVMDSCCKWLSEEGRVEARAVDITAGTKLTTAALIEAANRTGARVYYLSHEVEEGTPTFGTEKIRYVE